MAKTGERDQGSTKEQPDRPQTRREYRGTGIWWGLVAALLVLGAIVAVVVQNGDTVRFEWLFFDIEASLAVLLLVTALGTVVADELVGLVWRHYRRRRLRRSDAAREPSGGS